MSEIPVKTLDLLIKKIRMFRSDLWIKKQII